MEHAHTRPRLTEEAAIACALADTTIPSAGSPEDEAERWVRILRRHGEVGCALLSLGVPAGPLETPARDPDERRWRRGAGRHDSVELVRGRATDRASAEGRRSVTTVDLLFALIATYDGLMDEGVRARGTTLDELLERLRERRSTDPCSGSGQAPVVERVRVPELAASPLRNAAK